MKPQTLLALLAVATTGCRTASPKISYSKPLQFTSAPNFFPSHPGGQSLGPCHGGVVMDQNGNIYVSTDTKRGILVFSPAGNYVRSFGPPRIHAMEIRREGRKEYIYAARPVDHQVLKLALDGTAVWTLRYPKDCELYKKASDFKPCAVTVAPDGSVFVADGYGSNHVLKFDKNRKFTKAFGSAGADEGKFNICHGIVTDTRQEKPLLLVCNRNNNRVEYWDLDGNFVKVIQRDLRMPAAVHIRGDYAVVPELQGRVTLLDKDGGILARIGENSNAAHHANFPLPPVQWQEGVCNSPHGAFLTPDGSIVVTEWSQFGRLHKFTPSK